MRTSVLRLVRALHLGSSAVLLAAAAVQAATFILLARGLGVTGFGSLMILTAVTQVAVELVSLGAGEALIRRTARDPRQHGPALGHALIMTLGTAVPFGLVAILAIQALAPEQPLMASTVFAFGELLGVRFAGLSEHAFIAHGRVPAANLIRLLPALARLLAVVGGLYVLKIGSVDTWVVVQGATSLVVGVLCLAATIRTLGRPRARLHPEDVRFGTMVALTHLSATVQFAADRLVLGLVSTPAVVGGYAAAMRGVQLAVLPVLAIMRNVYAGFFVAGDGGIAGTRAFALANLRPVVVVGALAGGVLIAGADLLVLLLGREFAASAAILRGLSVVPLARGIQLLMADALSGADHQGTRTALGMIGSAVFVVVLAVLARAYGVWGAVAAVYLHQVGMIVAYGLAIRLLGRGRP